MERKGGRGAASALSRHAAARARRPARLGANAITSLATPGSPRPARAPGVGAAAAPRHLRAGLRGQGPLPQPWVRRASQGEGAEEDHAARWRPPWPPRIAMAELVLEFEAAEVEPIPRRREAPRCPPAQPRDLPPGAGPLLRRPPSHGRSRGRDEGGGGGVARRGSRRWPGEEGRGGGGREEGERERGCGGERAGREGGG